MMQSLLDYFRKLYALPHYRWQRKNRHTATAVDTPLLRALQGLSIKSQERGANPRLPTTRPAEPHFGRRERVQNYGRE